jgi:hypothetical protein
MRFSNVTKPHPPPPQFYVEKKKQFYRGCPLQGSAPYMFIIVPDMKVWSQPACPEV